MTYKKASPIGAQHARSRTIQPCIIAQDSVSPSLNLFLSLTSSNELNLHVCASQTQTTSPSTSNANMTATWTGTAAQGAPLGSASAPASSTFDEDDYENCADYDNAFSDSHFDQEWDTATGTPKRVFDETDFGADDDGSSSETDSLFDYDLSYPSSISLHASTDLLSVPATLSELPHWWGEEDSEHIAAILQHYLHTLGIDAEQKKAVRAAVPFVGHVVRHQVPSVRSLQSIDEVSVYRYEMVPFGQTMPLIRRHWVLTTWDIEAGLPTSQLLLTKPSAQTIWLPKARSNLSTSLFCEPDASAPAHFVYTVERETTARDFVSIGYHNSSLSYSRFFPEAAFHGNAPIDD